MSGCLNFALNVAVLAILFERSVAFMERMDSNNDDDFQYGPWMKGSKLPTSGYDRYRTDFSKANAWPLLTRLARKSISSSLPTTQTRGQPQPRVLLHGESSTSPFSQTNTMTIPAYTTKKTSHQIAFLRDQVKLCLFNSHFYFNSGGYYATPPTAMKILSWNARGLGNPNAFRHLRLLVQQQSPHVLFLMETKLGSNLVTRFRNSLHFANGLEAPRIGLSGSLMLLWKDNVIVKLSHFGHTFFDCFMAFEDGPSFHFTAFYGAPAIHEIIASWTLLERLADNFSNQPWLVIGDFNEILSNIDKEGGPQQNERLMNDFRACLDHCNLNDTPYDGDSFTWIKNCTAATTLKERLDWCFINNLWDNVFGLPQVSHLDYFHSDHRAIAAVIATQNDPVQQSKRRSRFHFEKLWLADDESREIISHCWLDQSSHNPIENVLNNLEACATNLQKWHIGKYDRMKKKIAETQTHVTELNNTLNIFQASPTNSTTMSSVLETIPEMVTADMNHDLTKTFTIAKVDEALKSMSLDKSPGIDGMPAMFYQQHWDLVGDLVSKVVLGVLNDGADPTPLNRTIITLIPKIKKPQKMKDYQPISLCNVISKLITKVLVARFKVVLPHVILETQSAFLPNRLITDNILVAFELVHAIKNRTTGRKGIFSLKLDMSKAFDRVEWHFIQEVMRKMGFAEQWISLIMTCLSTNTFSFTVNGEVSGSLTLTWGLRQGCPLSPHLFLICSEGLSRLLQFEEKEGRLTGFKLTRNASPISHLLFADDSLLFYNANESSCLAIKKVLDMYHRASGQLLNHDKSVMSFSLNTTLASQVFFHRNLSMPICECHEKYLGLPSYTGRDKQHFFSEIKEKIWRLMHNWNEKIFSAGGREVLLKVVV
uniref:Reverse transcriptase domain-containing protein n=1 Tax=Cannabis sativa TaxID=3483 RepID=A0A803Q5N3_CANSA